MYGRCETLKTSGAMLHRLAYKQVIKLLILVCHVVKVNVELDSAVDVV